MPEMSAHEAIGVCLPSLRDAPSLDPGVCLDRATLPAGTILEPAPRRVERVMDGTGFDLVVALRKKIA